MTAVYQLLTKAASPIKLAETKSYLKIKNSSDDTVIKDLITAATIWGENYVGRDFRVKTWKLLLDAFADRITLRRDPVASITTVKYLVSDVLTTVTSSTYYLKKLVTCSEIILADSQSWPTDIDDREQAIEIEFATSAYFQQEEIKRAVIRHVAFMYENRGDCDDLEDGAKKSGVTDIYDQFRVERI